MVLKFFQKKFEILRSRTKYAKFQLGVQFPLKEINLKIHILLGETKNVQFMFAHFDHVDI